MNISPKNNPEKFNQFLFEQLNLDLFEYKFLRNYIVSAQKGEKMIDDASILNIHEKGWILILHGDELLVYGENWSKNQFKEIALEFDFNNYRNYLVSGDSDLIHSLISYNKVSNHHVEKKRIFYRTTQIKEIALLEDFVSLGELNG